MITLTDFIDQGDFIKTKTNFVTSTMKESIYLSNNTYCSPLQTYADTKDEFVSEKELSDRMCAISSITMDTNKHNTLFNEMLEMEIEKYLGSKYTQFPFTDEESSFKMSIMDESINNFGMLGKGVNGIVIDNITDTRLNNVVFKLSSDPTASIHEAFVGMFNLNKLRKSIPNFMYVYSMKKTRIFDIKDPSKNVVIFLEKIKGKVFADYVEDKKVSNVKILGYLLQIIYALGIAYKACEYRHCDLHLANIILREIKGDSDFYINYNGDFINSDKVATIIDYGLSQVKYEDASYSYTQPRYELYKYSDALTLVAAVSTARPEFAKCLQYFFKDDIEVLEDNAKKIMKETRRGLFDKTLNQKYDYIEFANYCQNAFNVNLIQRINNIFHRDRILNYNSHSMNFSSIFNSPKVISQTNIIEFYDDYQLKKVNLSDAKVFLTPAEFKKYSVELNDYFNKFASGTSSNNSHLTRGFDAEIANIKKKMDSLVLNTPTLSTLNTRIFVNYTNNKHSIFETEYSLIAKFIKKFNSIKFSLNQLSKISKDFDGFGNSKLEDTKNALKVYKDRYSKIKDSIIKNVEIYAPEILGNALSTDDAITKTIIKYTKFNTYDVKLRSLYSLLS